MPAVVEVGLPANEHGLLALGRAQYPFVDREPLPIRVQEVARGRPVVEQKRVGGAPLLLANLGAGERGLALGELLPWLETLQQKADALVALTCGEPVLVVGEVEAVLPYRALGRSGLADPADHVVGDVGILGLDP